MNKLKTLRQCFSLAFAAVLSASAVCVAQTPAAANPQSTTGKTAPAAPDRDKSAAASPSGSNVEEELAGTPAGKTVAKFFNAFNSGDIKQMRAFHESTGGNPENADRDFEAYERTGGLKLHSLLPRAAKDKIAVLVQRKKDARWLTFEFTVGTEDPYPINMISASPAEPPARTSN